MAQILKRHHPDQPESLFMLCLSRALMPGLLAHLKDVVGTLTTEIVLAGQDDHRFGEHLQTDGADKLLLQIIHAL